MIDRYMELKRKQKITYDDAVELKSIEIASWRSSMGLPKGQVEDLTEATNNYAEALRSLSVEELKTLQTMHQTHSVPLVQLTRHATRYVT